MRRKLALLLGFAFGLAVLRLLRRSREAKRLEPPFAPGPANPHAQELRRKLAESRAGEDSPIEATAELGGGPTVEQERQRVHDQARSVLDEMRRSETPTS